MGCSGDEEQDFAAAGKELMQEKISPGWLFVLSAANNKPGEGVPPGFLALIKRFQLRRKTAGNY